MPAQLQHKLKWHRYHLDTLTLLANSSRFCGSFVATHLNIALWSSGCSRLDACILSSRNSQKEKVSHVAFFGLAHGVAAVLVETQKSRQKEPRVLFLTHTHTDSNADKALLFVNLSKALASTLLLQLHFVSASPPTTAVCI